MKSSYKRLGDYIRQVDVRNRDLAVTELLGLSIAKQFIPSIANIIGTDLSSYKIVKPRQFGYVPVTSRNGDKITVALYAGKGPCIISQAYTVFEVINENELLPEYLMMWFRRPEFDRYARFKSHGSAREVFEWDEMCDVLLPVPPIEEQRKIVAEYQAIEQRIENNRRLIATLEDTAQTIYRQMFVDNIDPENLPEGWRMGNLYDLTDVNFGGDWGKEQEEGNYSSKVKCIRGADIPGVNINMIGDTPTRYILNKNLLNKQILQYDLVVEISGGTPTKSTGRVCQITPANLNYFGSNLICSNFCRVVRPKVFARIYLFFVFKSLYEGGIMFKHENSTNGLKNLDLDAVLSEECCIIPSADAIEKFSSIVSPIIDYVHSIGIEQESLSVLLSTLLKRL